MYESVNEAQTRLAGTVIYHKGEPHYVEGIDHNEENEIIVVAHELPRMTKTIKVKLTDPDLNYKKFQLGYINTPYGAAWGHRTPCRGRFKQGICKENLAYVGLPNKEGRNRIDFGSTYKSVGFRDMLVGSYPELEEAIQRLQAVDAPPSVAFHKNYALVYDKFRDDFQLQYKGEEVAFGKGPTFDLSRQFTYLREVMQSNGIKIR